MMIVDSEIVNNLKQHKLLACIFIATGLQVSKVEASIKLEGSYLFSRSNSRNIFFLQRETDSKDNVLILSRVSWILKLLQILKRKF